MSLAIDIWLLSALLVLAVVTLGVVLDTGAQRLNHDRSDATSTSRQNTTTPEKRTHIERFVYRHHRFFGAFVLIGAGVYLVAIAATGLLWPAQASGVLGLLLPMLTLVHLALLPFGAVMLLRPSLLKRLEAASNRWIELPGNQFKPLLRILVGLYCLAALIVLIAERVRALLLTGGG